MSMQILQALTTYISAFGEIPKDASDLIQWHSAKVGGDADAINWDTAEVQSVIRVYQRNLLDYRSGRIQVSMSLRRPSKSTFASLSRRLNPNSQIMGYDTVTDTTPSFSRRKARQKVTQISLDDSDNEEMAHTKKRSLKTKRKGRKKHKKSKSTTLAMSTSIEQDVDIASVASLREELDSLKNTISSLKKMNTVEVEQLKAAHQQELEAMHSQIESLKAKAIGSTGTYTLLLPPVEYEGSPSPPPSAKSMTSASGSALEMDIIGVAQLVMNASDSEFSHTDEGALEIATTPTAATSDAGTPRRNDRFLSRVAENQ